MRKQQGLTVTSIDDLVKASQGTLVELPPFVEGTQFVAKLKRPSMLALIRSGKIPNSLLLTANELFAKGTYDTDDQNSLSNLFEILDALCDACFVEPKFSALKSAGIELTDDQYMFVFNYTQRGIDALTPFRQQYQDNQPDLDGENVQYSAE